MKFRHQQKFILKRETNHQHCRKKGKNKYSNLLREWKKKVFIRLKHLPHSRFFSLFFDLRMDFVWGVNWEIVIFIG
jgi:hypothetical protein